MIFENRIDAGRKLAKNLLKYNSRDALVLAIARSGIPVAVEVAKKLNLPLKIFVSQKITPPIDDELAIGAVTSDNVKVLNHDLISNLELSENEVQDMLTKAKLKAKKRVLIYRKNGELPDLRLFRVIIVDDGAATGITIVTAIKSILKKNPKSLVIAIPVCSLEALERIDNVLRHQTDKVICLKVSRSNFSSLDKWYREFKEVTDHDLKEIINLVYS